MKPISVLAHIFFGLAGTAGAGTLIGHVRDQNWYAQFEDQPFGVGQYEFAVNANAATSAGSGAAAATDVFGAFSASGLPAGSYTVASWDVWWRSAYAFNVAVPASGNSADVDLRLRATMWGYPAFWDSASYHEFGQTFVATGPISMIYLRDPLNADFTRTVTVRQGGPGGAAIGVGRTYGGGGDQRLIYGYAEMPTVAGETYYLRLRTPSASTGAVIMQMDPRPDYSDPMPGGSLFLGNGTTLTPYPDRDLGVVIMSDDDGLITNLFARTSGTPLSGVTSVGQSFVARGVNLISAALWLADGAAPSYVVRVLESGPGGPPVGPSRRGRPARLSADPEMIAAWSPGECPLAAGQTYYLEVTREGGGTFNSVYVNRSNPFAHGQAFQNGTPVAGVDLAGTLMEEESNGSATRPAIRFTAEPTIAEVDRGVDRLRVQWTTDVASDSLVEFAADHPPYSRSFFDAAPVTVHSVELRDLQPHTLYHFRATSAAVGRRPAISRDRVVCTASAAGNRLANPGFEEGTGSSPRSTIPGWTKGGNVDVKFSNGTWFGSLPARTGGWFLQGALNGGSSDGHVYQRVTAVTPGQEYTFSAWVTTWPIENGTWKYDVWQAQGRLIHMRLGVDPTGGTNPASSSVRWTPRMYSHRRYSNPAVSATAQGTSLTVFISMKGEGVTWHLYGVDDAVLSHEEIPTRLDSPTVLADGTFQATLFSRANRTSVVDYSTNIFQWLPLKNLLNPSGSILIEDETAPATEPRFYRARTLPAP